ncbi:DNA polymerase zeta catalytic subunit [Sesamum angolense]|uniref:DNA polymerase zeta catalytic subunit n=1 Tax=Sesamum angolense TaxID=2727404 RepID=A0AAE1X7Q8_9LAMI|nr:DNA polymerase zeta catalytic subunit [Sesamum angolense]
MGDSQPQAFSVRIVSIDHYMAPPIPGFDVSYSSFHVDSRTHSLSLALEKALKLKGSAGSKRQHVHGCELVRAKKFYGYYSPEELFVKIFLYPSA